MNLPDALISQPPVSEKKVPRALATPPEWAIERAIKSVGRIPAALGRGLDRAAKVPVLGMVVRLFSSIPFGLIVLAMIALYIAIGSGFANIRADLEMTDLQFFDAWPMRVLLVLLVCDLTVVTLRRIPLTLFKLGSWTVHVGIITLITGSVIYFGLKQEGSARIYLNQSVDACYDTTERALYAYPIKADGTFDTGRAVMTAMPGMPYFHERLSKDGNALDVPLGNAGLTEIDPKLANVAVKVVGYYPAAEMREVDYREGAAGEKGVGPAIEWTLDSERGRFGGADWLMANFPAARVMEAETLPFAIEYLYHPTAERVRDLQASFEGALGITVRIGKLGIEKTYGVKKDEPIVVEGSPYTLTPIDVSGNPMISKGYEGAFSSGLTVAVTRKNADGSTFEFERQALFRYPERSPDWVMENGKRTRKQEGVDGDIEIRFHDATRAQYWIIEEEGAGGGKLRMISRASDGVMTKAVTADFGADGVLPLEVKGFQPMKLRLLRHFANRVAIAGPVEIPKEQRKLAQSAQDVIQQSIAIVRVSTGDGKWSTEQPVQFSQFAEVTRWGDESDPGRDPTVIDVPGLGKFGLLMSTVKRALPAAVTLTAFQAEKYPGAANTYMDYYSTLQFKDKASGALDTQVIHLNNPGRDHHMTYFQAFWDGHDVTPDERRFSIVGIANRPGVWGMIAGAGLIVLGIGYAFYAKPILLKKKKAFLAAWAATNKGAAGPAKG